MRYSSLLTISLSTFLTLSTMSPSDAAKLTSNAKKATPTEIKKIYSGKSVFWSKTVGYFKPDGTFLARKKNNNLFVIGKWKASNGKMCRSGKWFNLKNGKKGSFSNVCMLWMNDSGKFMSIEADKKNKKSHWSNTELSKLKSGDSVSKKLAKMQQTYNAKF